MNGKLLLSVLPRFSGTLGQLLHFLFCFSGCRDHPRLLILQVDEAVHHDQLVMLEKLYNALTKIDLAAGNQVITAVDCLFVVYTTKLFSQFSFISSI